MRRPASGASMPGTVRSESRARAASMIWLDEPRNGRASSAITVRAGRVHMRSSSEYLLSPHSRTPGSIPESFLNFASDRGSLRMRASCLALGRATLRYVQRAVLGAKVGDHRAKDLHGI